MAAIGKLRRVSELKRQDYGEELDYSVRRIPGRPLGQRDVLGSILFGD